MKTWILAVSNTSYGYGFVSFETGTYYLIDPETLEVHEFFYISGGLGFSASLPLKTRATGVAQFEVGLYEGPCDPTQIHDVSLAINAFAAAGKGISGQLTGTSFWGSGDFGFSGGVAGGIGAGLSAMLTKSYYSGSSDVIPAEIKRLVEDLIPIGKR